MTPRRDWEAEARGILDPVTVSHIAEGAQDGGGVRAAEAAWKRCFVPRILRDVTTVDLGVSCLGQPCGLPVLLAPAGYLHTVHQDGLREVIRGAAAASTVAVIPTRTERRLKAEDLAGRRAWFQLYTSRDRSVTDARLGDALAAGCSAVLLTVDAPVLGLRREGVATFRRRAGSAAPGPGQELDCSLDWAEAERIRATCPVPIALKGVVHPDDARHARDAGFAGVIVSTHGGRQLEGALPAASALPSIVEAAGDGLEVYVDGGIRTGEDVLRALALGARATFIGRPYLWALAAAGGEGVTVVLDRFALELEVAMRLTGQSDAGVVDRSIVRAV